MKVEGADLRAGDEDAAAATSAALDAMAAQIELLRGEVAALQAQLAQAEALADADVLTPSLNRRAFLRELQRAIATAQRHEIPAAVVYFDLDGFKQVNDRFGHAAGDAALKAVAERLAANVRGEDVVARLGGDEFAVLLVHADRESAILKAQALKAAIEGEPVIHGGAPLLLRITYGVRQLGGTDDAEHALAEADAAMYLRKPSRG
jgi:diguanylate cyclase (GGDEF)-like protein